MLTQNNVFFSAVMIILCSAVLAYAVDHLAKAAWWSIAVLCVTVLTILLCLYAICRQHQNTDFVTFKVGSCFQSAQFVLKLQVMFSVGISGCLQPCLFFSGSRHSICVILEHVCEHLSHDETFPGNVGQIWNLDGYR